VDSQMLEAIQACPRLYKYKFIDNLRPLKKSEYLDKGSLLHECLEIFYLSYEEKYEERIKLAIAHGQKYSIGIALPIEDCNEVIFQFKEYAEHYKMDGWKPLVINGIPLVEHCFSVILHEDEEIKIIYSGKIDLIAETPVGKIIVDHKSESRRSEPSTLTNQFIGYASALQIYSVWINKVGFQKTLSRNDRFRRIMKSYNPGWIEEWKIGVVQDIKDAVRTIQAGDFRGRFVSCDRYTWGCDYKSLCETTEDNRVFKAKVFFQVGEQWDPYHSKKSTISGAGKEGE